MLHEILTKRRKELGLSLDSLAEKSQVSKSTLAKIMSGATPNPQFETLRAIAYALEMSLSDIGYSENDYLASTLSPAALRVARVYDSLPEPGKRALDAFCDFAEDRG